MHLTPAQLKRFTRLFYSLLIYANDKYDVLGGPFEPWADDGVDQILDLSQFVFEDYRAVIGEYLAENPDELAKSALDQVAQWNKAAFAEAFFVVEVSEQYTTLIGDECLFNVTGLDQEAAVDLGSAGDATFTVLLPFEDRIVYGVVASPVPDDFSDMREQVAADALDMLAAGLVASTAADLMKVGPGCVERSLARREMEKSAFGSAFGGLFGDAAGAAANAANAEPGTHVGALAGLSDEERDAAIMEHISTQMPQFGALMDIVSGQGVFTPAAPVRTVAGMFELLNKQQLYELTKKYGIGGCSKMKKAELVTTLSEELLKPDNAQAIMSLLTENDRVFATAKAALAAAGEVSMPAAEHRALPKAEQWSPSPPFLNVFEHDGTVTCIIPDEVRGLVGGPQWDDAVRKRDLDRHAHHLVETYMEMCGIISIDELTSIYLRYYPHEMSRREFGQFIYDYGMETGDGYDIWTYKGEPHVIHFDLVAPEESKNVNGPVDLNGDMLGKKPTSAESWRRDIWQCHQEIMPWEPAGKTVGALEAFMWDRHVMGLPSYKALQAFVDAHIPNGRDDYFYTDKLLEELHSIVNYGAGPEALIKHMQDQGMVLLDAGESAQLLVLLSVFVNDLPRWDNNGWSAKELAEQGPRK